MLEEERKYDVGVDFVLPDLKPCLPRGGQVVRKPARNLRATYHDTADLRLARAGASLRYRAGEGDKPPWTAKLPTSGADTRDEITRTGPARTVPADLVAVLTAYHRGAPLAPVVTLRTARRVLELRDRGGALLAEVADDTVSVLDGRTVVGTFREVEVERAAGGQKLLDRVDEALVAAGAKRSAFVSKLVRALGDRAAGPADLAAPEPLPRKGKATAADVVTAALRKDVAKIFGADAYLRLRTNLPDGDTPVHQMRVGCRRLRSDLRTFRPLLDAKWSDELRREAGWLAGVLGAARDAEVLRLRLRRTAEADPIAPLDGAAVARIDAELAARQEEALQRIDEAVASPRYVAVLDALVDAVRAPRFTDTAAEPAPRALPPLVAKPWRQLADGTRDGVAAGELDPADADESWHDARIRGKRARYATEAVCGLLGGDAAALATALGEVQELLGEHQDAAIAADTWLAVAQSDVDDHALAVTAGRLVERERSAIRRVRARFPAAWAAANQPRNVEWLSTT